MIRHKKWDIDKYNIIKHIGKGSFSNVYLCKNELDLLCEDIYNNEEYFIIKEININVLVDKYMSNSKSEYRFNKMQQKKGNSDVSVNITPYTKNNAIMVSSKSTERDYYYHKLKGLIESEIEILNLLNHSCIIKFNNYMEYDNVYYLNLEYCDKGDVYYMLKNENYEITNEYIYEFLNQTANGLAYMHNNNIIHRDIKLQNILVKTDERLNNTKFKYVFKLSDFGFSCYDMSIVKFEEEEYLDDMLCKKYYKLCGTPYFMAPEIILNMNKLENFTFYDEKRKINSTEFYDKRIDIWSYGICIYELITNKMPFSNIRNFKDLEKLYKREDIQIYIDSKIDIIKDEILNRILYMTLKVNEKTRCFINEICDEVKNINEIQKLELDIIDESQNESSFFDVFKHNVFKHIVSNPINALSNRLNNSVKLSNNVSDINNNNQENQETKSENQEVNSWIEINNSSSLMMKLSVEKNFLDWLLKK